MCLGETAPRALNGLNELTSTGKAANMNTLNSFIMAMLTA